MAENEAPSWLTEDNAASAPAAAEPSATPEAPGTFSLNDGGGGGAASSTPAPTASSAGTSSAAAAAGADGDTSPVSEQDEKDLPGVILVMRLLNMAVSIVLVACSVVTMISLPTPATWVLSIYASCGGLLICCLETQLKFLRVIIAMNFGFLFSSLWRFLFYIILGTVTWAYGNVFGKATGICLGAVAVFNAYVLCRYPSYRKMREKIAEEEDKRIEARISKEVKKQAVKSAFGAS